MRPTHAPTCAHIHTYKVLYIYAYKTLDNLRQTCYHTATMIITTLLAALIVTFNAAIAQAPGVPTSYTYASRANGASFLKLEYGRDSILATTSADNHYTITLCSAYSCRNTDHINLDNAAFISAARSVGCTVYEDASFECPSNAEHTTGQ